MRWSRIQLHYQGIWLLLHLAEWEERGCVLLFCYRHDIFVTLALFLSTVAVTVGETAK